MRDSVNNMKKKVLNIICLISFVILVIVLSMFLWIKLKPVINSEYPAFNHNIADTCTPASTENNSEDASKNEQNPTNASTDSEKDGSFEMFFGGDVMLDNSDILTHYDNKGIKGILSSFLLNEMLSADMTVINEEFPFSTRGTPMEDKQFTFRVNPSYVNIFKESGVDMASLANNHALDYGTDALTDSFTTLDKAGIFYSGAGNSRERASKPYITKWNNKSIGVLSASRVIPVADWNIDSRSPGLLCTYDSTALVNSIKAAKKQCDFVAVYVHWGVERENMPQEYQQELAKAYINAGADLVIGSHPHVPQGVEYYNGKPIIYSLGNYIFNTNMESAYAVKCTLDDKLKPTIQLIPIYSQNACTQEMSGNKKTDTLKYIESISFSVKIDSDGYVVNNK